MKRILGLLFSVFLIQAISLPPPATAQVTTPNIVKFIESQGTGTENIDLYITTYPQVSVVLEESIIDPICPECVTENAIIAPSRGGTDKLGSGSNKEATFYNYTVITNGRQQLYRFASKLPHLPPVRLLTWLTKTNLRLC